MAQRITNTRRAINGILSFIALSALLALFFAFRHNVRVLHPPRVTVSIRHLPYYAYCSFYRMLTAYVIALLFSIGYGMAAARGRIWERIMVPAIDIAQSVPVVGFFPAAIYFFVALAHGSRLGVEMAAIFLIFTSQAWNMTLGVFESIKTIPGDSMEVLDAFGVSGWLRFKRLLLPACVPKLVYNSIVSWMAGWYFLIACEIITVGPAHYHLPGLGSYLMEAADRGRTMDIVSGLLALLLIIVAMDVIVWQPLSTWADKFRYEFAAAPPAAAASLGMLAVFGSIGPAVTHAMRALLRPVGRGFSKAAAAIPRAGAGTSRVIARVGRIVGIVAVGAIFLAFCYGIADGIVAMVRELAMPWPSEVRQIPLATGASILRLAVAYAISIGWTLPCALAVGESPRFKRIFTPLAEIFGSLPATALFPLIVLFVVKLTGGMNLASILLILTGMQWYLLFNLLAGVNSVPEDLKEAARAFGLSRMQTWRKLSIPALLPSLITGSITAWGGGWNALIVSEYFPYRGRIYSVSGLGALLDEATYKTGNGVMILLSLLSMVAVVLILNHLVWRRLYDSVAERYRIDY